jgi:hypothetical protein
LAERIIGGRWRRTMRTARSQSAHDKKVESLAKSLERRGFSVQADVEGYDKPTSFGGMRPDVIGRKGKERVIYEVETKDSVDSARDQQQQEEFKVVADRNTKTTFRRFLA